MEIAGNTVEFGGTYRRLPILDAIKEYAGVDVKGMDEDQLRATCKQLGVEIDADGNVYAGILVYRTYRVIRKPEQRGVICGIFPYIL